MKIVWAPVLSLAVLMNSIALGSQSSGSLNDEPDPNVPLREPSSSPTARRSPDTTLSLALPNASASSRTPITSPIRARSRSSSGRHHSSSMSPPPAENPLLVRFTLPALKQTFPHVIGYKFDDLGLIRLIPQKNTSRILELRRYVFPPDEPIRMKNQQKELIPMPTEEQIVLATSDGEVWAVLNRLQNRNQIFRGIFKYTGFKPMRGKINIDSGYVEKMTKEEIAECPVGWRNPIKSSFRVFLE